MKESEARRLLPGKGDIQEKVNDIIAQGSDVDGEIDMDQAEELLEWLVEFLTDESED